MSNIHSLSLSSESKRGENEEFFGGGATSGTAVWRPTNGPQRQQPGGGGSGPPPPASGRSNAPEPQPDLRQIIQQARESEAEAEQSRAARPGAARCYPLLLPAAAAHRRLPCVLSAAPAASAAEGRSLGVITIYSNGFVVDGGEFRDARDGRNAGFIAALRAGEVPAELEEQCRRDWGAAADSVQVSLVDRSSQQFAPPKPKFSFADSKGQQIAGGGSSSALSASSAAQLSRAAPRRYELRAAGAQTTLQVVAADRRRLRETLSEETTVAELYAHVAAVAPPAAGAAFELVAGFPPRALADGSLTLKQAGICNASVQQRISTA